MSANDWTFLILVSLLIGLLLGAWINQKIDDYRSRVLEQRLEEKTSLAAYYKACTDDREKERIDLLRDLTKAKSERDKYREFWADELQKRLDLADKLEKYTGGRPTTGRGESSADYPCD